MPTRQSGRKSPPATVLMLVRHGATPTTGKVLPGRAAGLHLSDEGRAQAMAVADAIAALGHVDAVYTSPLERARETARPIAARLGMRARADRGLVECDYGDWTGAELKSLAKLPDWDTVRRWPSGFRFPGGESLSHMQDRVVSAAERLRSRHPGGTVVAVSHADPIKALLAAALGMHLDMFQRIVVDTCSLSAVAYGPGGPSVLAVNATGTPAAIGAAMTGAAKGAAR